VQKLRVLVANRPRFMRDLVLATMQDQPDIEVVGETEDEAAITEMVERLRPDCLILAQDGANVRPDLCGFLLGRHPHMRILAVGSERNLSIFYWAFVDIRSKTVETSEQGMLSLLRDRAEMVPM
jgi:hypothetical protein